VSEENDGKITCDEDEEKVEITADTYLTLLGFYGGLR
jgi:hypothetical protein